MKNKTNPLIFIVEDDVLYQEMLKNELHQNQYDNIEVYTGGTECIGNLHKVPDIVMLDYNLNENMNGIQVLKKIKKSNSHTQVIMFSAQERLEVVINSIKYGAYDYIIKNDVAIRRLSQMVNKICSWNELMFENAEFIRKRNMFLAGLGVIVTIIMMLRFYFPRYFM